MALEYSKCTSLTTSVTFSVAVQYSCKIRNSVLSLFDYVFHVGIIFFGTPTLSFLNAFALAQTKSRSSDILGLAISSLHQPMV